jgi:hypothetical protein
MMKILRATVIAFLAGIAFSGTTEAQTWPKLLGEADPTVVAYTPKYNSRVYTGGFDQPRRKQTEKKLLNTLRKRNATQSTITTAQDYGRRLTGLFEPSTLLDEIDEAIDRVTATWRACGGTYASFASAFDWSRITFTVRDTVFANPGTGVMSGAVTMDKRNAHIVNLTFHYWFDPDPTRLEIAKLGDFARWEAGNILEWNRTGRPRELGDSSPCGR